VPKIDACMPSLAARRRGSTARICVERKLLFKIKIIIACVCVFNKVGVAELPVDGVEAP
jgi:hypothetical protein